MWMTHKRCTLFGLTGATQTLHTLWALSNVQEYQNLPPCPINNSVCVGAAMHFSESSATLSPTKTRAVYEAEVDDGQGHRIYEMLPHSLPALLVGPWWQQELVSTWTQLVMLEHENNLWQRAPFRDLICTVPATRLVHSISCCLSKEPPTLVDMLQPIYQ